MNTYIEEITKKKVAEEMSTEEKSKNRMEKNTERERNS